MVTRKQVPHDTRLPGSITVTVDAVHENPQSRRDAELTVHDTDGAELTIILWATHEIDQTWDSGATYELTGARGKRYSNKTGPKVEVHSTSAFEVREIECPDSTRICVLGDTHVGYRHRKRSNQAAWSYDVDNRQTFRTALRRARSQNADAVIHAGDIFDHKTTQSDLETVFDAVTKTCEQGIYFYFVHGNHDMAAGRRLLERLTTEHQECIHLSTEATPLAGREIALTGYGIDHTGTEVSPLAPDSRFKTVGSLVILVLHDTPFPVLDDQHNTIYSQEQLNLQDFLETSTVTPDLIIAGHMHVGSEGTVPDTEVPVVTTGPTARISDSTADNEPSTWRLTVTDSDIRVDRQPLKSDPD